MQRQKYPSFFINTKKYADLLYWFTSSLAVLCSFISCSSPLRCCAALSLNTNNPSITTVMTSLSNIDENIKGIYEILRSWIFEGFLNNNHFWDSENFESKSVTHFRKKSENEKEINRHVWGVVMMKEEAQNCWAIANIGIECPNNVVQKIQRVLN